MGVDVGVRVLVEGDTAAVTALVRANRAFMAPFDPERDDGYFTTEHQGRLLAQARSEHERGTTLPYGIVADGELVGEITVSTIVRGPFQSGELGYWVGEAHNGRGIATAAVAAMVEVAFREARLHRLQAGTLLDNVRSQRVLERNGFQRIGVAPRYLRIAGRWQDHVLYQRVHDGWG